MYPAVLKYASQNCVAAFVTFSSVKNNQTEDSILRWRQAFMIAHRILLSARFFLTFGCQLELR